MKALINSSERNTAIEPQTIEDSEAGIEIENRSPGKVWNSIERSGSIKRKSGPRLERAPFLAKNAFDHLVKSPPFDRSADLQTYSSPEIVSSTSVPAIIERDQPIFVQDGERCWFVPLQEIKLLESEGNYTRIHIGEEKPLILRSLNYLQERLDPSVFFRASRKYIVNLLKVETVNPLENRGLLLKLKDGLIVGMSRRQAQRFRDLMSL
jgi:two-component system LytT family response regulator